MNDEQTSYYGKLPKEYGFASRCRMCIPIDVTGLRVLDVDCRRGKGVVKFAELVGPAGMAMGVDPSSEWIDEARLYGAQALGEDAKATYGSLQFSVACAENLAEAGIGDASFDVVYVNSSLNLDMSPFAAIDEFARVLTPGGTLLFDGVVAEGPRNSDVVRAACALGNSVQAAFNRPDLERILHQAGFAEVSYCMEEAVPPEAAVDDDVQAAVAKTDEGVTFTKLVVLARKS